MIRKFCLTLAVISAASFTIVSAQQTAKVTASGIGYLEYLPQGYSSNSNDYPLVISLHGIKEKGANTTDRNRIIADLEKVDNVGLPKYVKQGKKYPFILISPQLKNNMGSWPPSYIMEVLKHVQKNLRIDDRRIYLTGLSLGGMGVWRTAGEYPEVFAAIGPICPGGNSLSKADEIAANNVAAWGFHGSNDHVVSYKVTTQMINAMNSAPKKPNPLAKATIFSGMGHIIWDKAYHETNLLDWMLSHRNGSSGGWSDHDENDDDDDKDDDNDSDNDSNNSNKQPVVKAGSDKTITLPTNALYIEGSANDPDGKITSYHWTKVSGGSASINGSDQRKMRAYNLKEGTYVFRLTAKDDNGAAKSDEMKVVVKGGAKGQENEDKKTNSKNSLPIVTAGPDRFITLPTNSIYIQAKASDKDGRITSYEWTQTYGLSRATVSGTNTNKMRAYNLRKGAYIFRLRVKDNDGGIKDDYFKITVNAPKDSNNGSGNKENNNSSKPNQRPYASAGPDRVLNLPTNSIYINASASDKDGKIVSYRWIQTYGKKARLSGDRTSRVRIYDLSKGPRIFKLVVTDDDGAVKEDYFKITVEGSNGVSHNSGNESSSGRTEPNRSSNVRPVADAGSDLRVRDKSTITLRGSGTDPDGRVVSYRWRQLAGPDITVRDAGSPEPTLTDLKEGRYYFSLTVKDDDNATHVDKMLINVTGS